VIKNGGFFSSIRTYSSLILIKNQKVILSLCRKCEPVLKMEMTHVNAQRKKGNISS